MQQSNSKYVIYRHVLTGSYQVFETNNKKEAIRFIRSIRYHIIKKPPLDSGYYLVIKRQVRIQNNELLNWVKEQKQTQSLSTAERRKKLWIMSLFGNVFVAGCALLYLLFADNRPDSLSDVMPALGASLTLSVLAISRVL